MFCVTRSSIALHQVWMLHSVDKETISLLGTVNRLDSRNMSSFYVLGCTPLIRLFVKHKNNRITDCQSQFEVVTVFPTTVKNLKIFNGYLVQNSYKVAIEVF
jgi:hypothetical protein